MTADTPAQVVLPEPDLVAELVNAYEAWLRLRGYEPMSADELMHEIAAPPPSERPAHATADLEWLQAFIDLWDLSRDITDAAEQRA